MTRSSSELVFSQLQRQLVILSPLLFPLRFVYRVRDHRTVGRRGRWNDPGVNPGYLEREPGEHKFEFALVVRIERLLGRVHKYRRYLARRAGCLFEREPAVHRLVRMYVARYARRINKSRSCHAVCRETRCLESAPRVLPSRLRARTRLRTRMHVHAHAHSRTRVHDLVLRLGGHVFFGAQVLPRFAGILARGFSSVVFSRSFSPSCNFLHELSSIYKRLLLSMQCRARSTASLPCEIE